MNDHILTPGMDVSRLAIATPTGAKITSVSAYSSDYVSVFFDKDPLNHWGSTKGGYLFHRNGTHRYNRTGRITLVSAAATSPFLVFSPQGSTAPRYQHATQALAQAEAERLAKLNPGKDFYVMGAITKSSTPKVVQPPVETVALAA